MKKDLRREHRITTRWAEQIGWAFADRSARLFARELKRVPIICDVDPWFLGLDYGGPGHTIATDAAGEPRLADENAHVHFEPVTFPSDLGLGKTWHGSRPRDYEPAVVLPPRDHDVNCWVVLHELGHVLEHRLRLRGVPIPDFRGPGMTEYGNLNICEAFAVAFSSVGCSDASRELHPHWWSQDAGTDEWFREMSRRLGVAG